MTAPTLNAALAYKVLDHIDAHPDSWNQAHWWCGTSGCFAGWTVQLSGENPDGEQVIDGVHISHRAAQLLGFADETAMNDFAYQLIGTGGEWELFNGGNDRDDLGWIVKAMFGPRPAAVDHSACDHAGKQVRCDRCGRGYVCTPADDLYCTPKGDHSCEACLIGGLPLVVVDDVPPNAGSAS